MVCSATARSSTPRTACCSASRPASGPPRCPHGPMSSQPAALPPRAPTIAASSFATRPPGWPAQSCQASPRSSAPSTPRSRATLVGCQRGSTRPRRQKLLPTRALWKRRRCERLPQAWTRSATMRPTHGPTPSHRRLARTQQECCRGGNSSMVCGAISTSAWAQLSVCRMACSRTRSCPPCSAQPSWRGWTARTRTMWNCSCGVFGSLRSPHRACSSPLKHSGDPLPRRRCRG
mmetsp:Transcript_117510/g.304926  ORF Transcript_117510/g.304926 Transcript_117510/m.304926 type:complete len:233 (-) Transcript_117510:1130-1828(-)